MSDYNDNHSNIIEQDSDEQILMGERALITPFATTNYRNTARKFGIKLDDRRRHMYIVGKTGMGKSVLLENMIINDIRTGHGLAVVDPHGDLAEKILGVIPNKRVNDVVYFNPSDVDFPVAFNPLETVDEKYRHLVASGLVGVFKKIWADSWGPRLEYILRNAILSLLEYPGSTLLGITRILVDKYYRKKVLEKLSDPVVRSFWVDEYDNYNEKFRTEAISPIQNKIGQFLSSAIIRNIVGQPKSTINLREVMDDRKILLLNLSKGRVGEDNSALLGAMMITKLQLAAMSRVDTPEEERADFFLYVDEFQNFATESFANILSEARKYRLNLIIAHQYIEQLGDVVKAAVFGNVGTMILFRVGAEDAEFLEKEFEPTFMVPDLVSLPRYQIYLKLMIDGITSTPFSANTLPPVGSKVSNRDKVVKVSRERYSKDRKQVEDRILRWAGVEEVFKENAKVQSKSIDPADETYKITPQPWRESTISPTEPPRLNLTQPRVNENLFESECWVCGRKIQLPFRPDGIRPIYCKDDMKKIRQGLIVKPKPKLVISLSTPATVPIDLPTLPNDTEPLLANQYESTSIEITPQKIPTDYSISKSAPVKTSTTTPNLHHSNTSPFIDVLSHNPSTSPPTTTNEEPTVSLHEVLTRDPISFNQRHHRSDKDKNQAIQKKNNNNSSILETKSIRPGEVIKLNQ